MEKEQRCIIVYRQGNETKVGLDFSDIYSLLLMLTIFLWFKDFYFFYLYILITLQSLGSKKLSMKEPLTVNLRKMSHQSIYAITFPSLPDHTQVHRTVMTDNETVESLASQLVCRPMCLPLVQSHIQTQTCVYLSSGLQFRL